MSHDHPWKVGYSLYRQAPLHTSEVCARKIATRLFNGHIYLVTYPLRFHHQCEHHTHLEASSCALWVPAIAAVPTPSHGSAIVASPNIPAVLPSQLPRTTDWYAKTKLHHILCQDVPKYAHGCTVFMGGPSMNRSLDLGMITNHRLAASHRTTALNRRHHTN
jgi:hypothetical protein